MANIVKLTDPNGFSLLALARCYEASKAVAWLYQHGAGESEQGYAACREGLAAQRSKVGKRRYETAQLSHVGLLDAFSRNP